MNDTLDRLVNGGWIAYYKNNFVHKLVLQDYKVLHGIHIKDFIWKVILA